MNIHPYSQCKIDINQFERCSRIKKGGFGSIYLVRDKETGKRYAAKVIDCDDNTEQCKKFIDRELGIMMLMNHPTIIKFYSFSLQDFQGENNVTIIMEYAKNGSLADVLQKIQTSFGPSEYSNTTRQIILIGVSRGMKYLHDRNIIHRDLKPGNILLDSEFRPHITDFGLSKYYEINHSKSQSQTVGTLSYMSPEVIRGSEYDTKTDVYSFGILMFEVLTDARPYPELESGRMPDFDFRIKVANENYRPVFDSTIQDKHRELIEACWSSDPEMRPTFSDIFNKLTSDEYFIADVDRDEIEVYIQDITEINDPMEKLIQEKEIFIREKEEIETTNNKLTEENSRLKSENERLTAENKTFKDKITDIEKRLEVKSHVSDFVNKSSFIDYINSGQVTPIEGQGNNHILRNLSSSNPFILGFDNPTDSDMIILNYRLIASEYEVRGTLNQFYSKLDTKSRYLVILGIALAMDDLSCRNKIHGNLNPEVILLNKSNLPIICDFGFSTYNDQKTFKISNLFFISPEVHEGREIDIKTDVYSYSMIVYLLLTNQLTFSEGPPYMIITNILKGKRPDLSTIANKNLRMILQKCFSKKPKDRPTFHQIVDILIEPDTYSAFGIESSSQINYYYKTQYKELHIKPSEKDIEKEREKEREREIKSKLSEKKVLKISCIGNTGTGKTAMIHSYNKNELILDTQPTVGADYIERCFNTEYGEIPLRIWDTSGQERFRSRLIPLYCSGSDAIILFTDVSQYQEYKELQWFFDMVNESKVEKVPLYLATTKIDRGWKSPREEIESFAKDHGMKLFVTSVRDLSTVDHMFKTIVDDLISEIMRAK